MLEFKRSVEQNKLESEGKYTEARQALEQQFREAATEAKDKRIAELEARVRELELIAPANTALADVVHDPSIVFKADLLKPDQIERESDGTVVSSMATSANRLANGPRLCPATCRKHQSHKAAERQPGATLAVMFLPVKILSAGESYNLTEQSRLYRTDRDMYERLKAAANR